MFKKRLNIKISLFAIVLILATSFFAINWYIINQFRMQLNNQVETIANIYHEKITKDIVDSEYLIETLLPLIEKFEFPIVISTKQSNGEINYEHLNLNIADSISLNEYNTTMFRIVTSMDKINNPLPIIIVNGEPRIQIHFGDPLIFQTIKWLPYLQFFFALLVLSLVFVGLKLLLANEKNYIYAGMSRETAHQLGTPISSLLGWVELLNKQNSNKKLIAESMKKDLNKLENISEKFNKIGSNPILVDININDLLLKIVTYYKSKIPKSSNLQIELNMNEDIVVKGDRILLYWAFENIIKNSLESTINKKNGIINLEYQINSGIVYIDIIDNGNGILRKNRSKIFNPGFSTKKRGWGIGLNLSKRIIEHIHKGTLKLFKSKINKTIFRISLRLIIP